jgi:hypothetical protein
MPKFLFQTLLPIDCPSQIMILDKVLALVFSGKIAKKTDFFNFFKNGQKLTFSNE